MLMRLGEAAGAEISTDVCIIGGGPAGITLARSLGAADRSVVLAEAGDIEYDPASQELYSGRVIGDDYFDLDVTRLRYLGGGTNHWEGHYAPVQPFDFRPKVDGVPTDWPIAFEEFAGYMQRAREVLPFGRVEPNRPVLGGAFERIDHLVSETPMRFGEAFLPELEKSANIKLLLQANFVGAEREGRKILRAQFKDYSDRELYVRAQSFVIACGGIETPRLLLHLNEKLSADFGNESGLLGRCFTEHPHANAGRFLITDEKKYNEINFRAQDYYQGDDSADFFQTSEAFCKTHGVLSVFFALGRPSDPEGAEGLLADLLCTAPDLGQKIARNLGSRLKCFGRIFMSLEQEPRRENGVELGEERDRFGIRRPVLRWALSPLDKKNARISVLRLGEALAQNDIARVQVSDWVLDEDLPISASYPAGNHHMGATRMAARASDGVVDPNCKVYGADNLFVAGSSVFPNIGYGSPTLPIVAMTLRLSDHLLTLGSA